MLRWLRCRGDGLPRPSLSIQKTVSTTFRTHVRTYVRPARPQTPYNRHIQKKGFLRVSVPLCYAFARTFLSLSNLCVRLFYLSSFILSPFHSSSMLFCIFGSNLCARSICVLFEMGWEWHNGTKNYFLSRLY